MEDRWLAFGKAELGVEWQQLEDEGAALPAGLRAELEALLAAEQPAPERDGDVAIYSARLTVDITPELRGRIKIAAIRRGGTVTDMLRELLAREFPDTGDTP